MMVSDCRESQILCHLLKIKLTVDTESSECNVGSIESHSESLTKPLNPPSQAEITTNAEFGKTSSEQQISTIMEPDSTTIISNGDITKPLELVSSSEQLSSSAICPVIYNLFDPDDLIYTHCHLWSVSHVYKMPQHDRNSELESQIVYQVDYYFSKDNLVKDPFLRMHMNEFGWVPIQLIAGFNRMKILTENVFVMLDVLRLSMVVEVQGYKVRRRGDWESWIWPPELRDLQYYY